MTQGDPPEREEEDERIRIGVLLAACREYREHCEAGAESTSFAAWRKKGFYLEMAILRLAAK